MVLETMIWVAVIVIAAILEGMSAQLISIWFVGGGIAGMIAQLCGAPVWLQVLIAAVVTLVLLLATRPLVKKFLHSLSSSYRIFIKYARGFLPRKNILHRL